MVAGFLATTWMAGRVYRIGILMHGAKVNYKVMFKWLMMKN
jgi:ABC-2 type transport system permease protein